MKDALAPYTSRKFLISAASLCAATYGLITGHLSDVIFRDITLGVLGLYSVANVTQKVTTATKSQ